MGLIDTAIGSISSGVLKKIDESEAKRNREFSLKLKELELYKGNYDEEIKDVLDRWFDLLYSSLDAGKKTVVSEQGNIRQHESVEDSKAKDYRKLQEDTMKYGGTETGKALALFSQISYRSDSVSHKFASVYAICFLLSTIKREALGQELTSDTILKILLKDYDENSVVIKDSRDYVIKVWKELFPKDKIEL